MSRDKRCFYNKCFRGDWQEIDLRDARPYQEREEENIILKNIPERKDLATLLAELEEIKNTFNVLEEKKHRLKRILSFYRRSLAEN